MIEHDLSLVLLPDYIQRQPHQTYLAIKIYCLIKKKISNLCFNMLLHNLGLFKLRYYTFILHHETIITREVHLLMIIIISIPL